MLWSQASFLLVAAPVTPIRCRLDSLMPLIHQIALGDNIPEINRVCLNSWHKLTDRDFHIVSWTDQRIRDDLAISNMVLVQKLLEAARTMVKRATSCEWRSLTAMADCMWTGMSC